MDIKTERHDIIERLMQLDDESLLMEIKKLLASRAEQISEERKAFLEERLRESPESGREWRTSIKEIAERHGLASDR